MATPAETLPAAGAVSLPGDRQRRTWTLALLLAALGALYWPSLVSMVQIWWRSETFAHGFFIFPIAAWLVWERRRRLATVGFRTDWRALPLLLGLGFGWALARAADVQVVHQFAFVALIPVLVWLLLGWQALKELAFPLGFLLLAVPAGEGLRPMLIDFTADFVVQALRLSGIPVYREGTFFVIPSGSWSVVTGCSGLRYLMATVTVALLFAYLQYRAVWRRVVFVGAAIAVSILANGMRAYGIVMIAHLSDMKLALGIDHYIYGWVFYGVIIFVLLWLGMLWREPPAPADPPPAPGKPDPARGGASVFAPGGAALAVLILWPALVHAGSAPRAGPGAIPEAPAPATPWRVQAQDVSTWRPIYVGAGAERTHAYAGAGGPVALHLAWYPQQSQDAEVINARNKLIEEKDPVWREIRHGVRLIGQAGGLAVFESRMQSVGQDLLVWRWYWIAGHYTVNPYLGKLYEALGVLGGQGRPGAGIVLATPLDEDPEPARARLRAWAAAHAQALDAALGEAGG